MAVGMLVSCAGNRELLRVKQYHLRDLKVSNGEEPMARGEKLRRLYGAISQKEREARRGDYFTVFWHDREGGGPTEVVFEYQQGATASMVKRVVKRFPAEDTSGTAEFSVIDKNFQVGGRVLAWKASLVRGGRVLASRHSYLWQ